MRMGRGEGDDTMPDAVLVESIYRFKGLERPVIVLVDLEHEGEGSGQIFPFEIRVIDRTTRADHRVSESPDGDPVIPPYTIHELAQREAPRRRGQGGGSGCS